MSKVNESLKILFENLENNLSLVDLGSSNETLNVLAGEIKYISEKISNLNEINSQTFDFDGF